MGAIDGDTADGRATKMVVLTEVNAHILEVATESVAVDEEWEFFCECGHPGCASQVGLTADAYELLRVAGGAILAPGHRFDARARSRALRDEALALRAQALHQVRRARKNLDDRAGDRG